MSRRISGLPLPLLFALLAVLFRIPLLLAYQDTWLPYEVWCGTITSALLDGVSIQWEQAPVVPHIRGGILFGVLLLPLYLVSGRSLLVLKVLPLLWHAMTVALVVAILNRFVSRRVAIAGGILFLCAPPLIANLSVVGLSSHLESYLPFLLALWPFLRMTVDGEFSRMRWMLFGAAVGFAAFFHLQALLPCLILLVLLVLVEPGRFLRGLIPLMVTGAVVFLPAFLFNYRNPAITTDFALLASRISAMVTHDWWVALGFTGSSPGAGYWLGWIFGTGLLVASALACVSESSSLRRMLSWIFVRSRAGTRPTMSLTLPLLAHVLVIILTASLSTLSVEEMSGGGIANRHLIPGVCSMLMLSALGVGSIRFRAAGPILGTMMAASSLLAVGLGAFHSGVVKPVMRGECYEWFGRHLYAKTQTADLTSFISLLDRIDQGDPRFWTLRFSPRLPQKTADFKALSAGKKFAPSVTSMPSRLFRITGVGRWIARDPERTEKFTRSVDLNALPAAEKHALLHGIGLELGNEEGVGRKKTTMVGGKAMGRAQKLEEQARKFGDTRAAVIVEGVGFREGSLLDPYTPGLQERISEKLQLSGALRKAYFRGVGWGVRQRYLMPPTELPGAFSIRECIPEENREDFDEAFLGRVLPLEAGHLAR